MRRAHTGVSLPPSSLFPGLEGCDELIVEGLRAEEISIGDYVLTGGELPAMVIADAVTMK